MKFFIDTANLDAIREIKAMGMCDGVTTNPSLMAKEGNTDTDAVLKEICDVVQGPVSGEVIEVNETLADAPETINQDAYEEGWIFRLRLTEPDELDGLMDADSYAEHAESDEH